MMPALSVVPARTFIHCLFHLMLLLALVAGGTGLSAAQLLVSTTADRSNPVTLETAPVEGVIYIFVGAAPDADQVRFYVDGSLVQTENTIPWDFAGTTPEDLAAPFDTRTIADGQYQVSATVFSSTGSETLSAALHVANEPPPESGGDARQLHLGWESDPATSLSVTWFGGASLFTPQLRYRLSGDSNWQSLSGEVRTEADAGRYLIAHMTGLLPATAYEFQVTLGTDVWSRTYRGRTQPAKGPANLSAVYVADTGLIGRDDGLTTGTAAVITEIAMLEPGLVLLGGDYVYFDTDKRFGTLERSIGVWFEQMAPVAETAPMMPTWGNHEVRLQETVETWLPFFATPDGWNNRRMYSFDVGDVHFVSVYGFHESQQMTQDAIDWLAADLEQASQAGQRWLVPYFHAAPFSEGTNHPSALTLRQQLGPLFEAAGVKVVLTSHDQSYERTFPLTGVPSSISSTSSNNHCYSQADGVSWLKVSPGGKLSNISRDFSPWRSPEAPYWTAARDNTRHHFAHLIVTADGELTVDIYGVAGDADDAGVPVRRSDRVRYTSLGCAPELRAEPGQLTFALDPQGSDSQEVLITSTGNAVAFELSQLPDWLSVSPLSGVTPATVTFTANAQNQPLGSQRAVLEISEGAANAAWLPVDLTVGAASYGLWLAANPQRLSPQPLDDQVLQGDVYVFTQPDDSVARVRFYLDDPGASGSALKTENVAPFDLGGTSGDDTALPFDTLSLADGRHSLTARLDLDSGGQILVTSEVQVQNQAARLALSAGTVSMTVNSPDSYAETTVLAEMTDGQTPGYSSESDSGWLTVSPGSGQLPQSLVLAANTQGLTPGNYQGLATVTAATGEQDSVVVNLAFDVAQQYRIEVSDFPDRRDPGELNGAALSAGNVYVFVPDSADIRKVEFFLDDPGFDGSPIKVENRAPWDFAGTETKPPRDAIGYDLSGLSGDHVISARLRLADGEVAVHAAFTVVP